MELLQLKVALRVHITLFHGKSENRNVFTVCFVLEKKIILSAASDVVLSALFVVNLEGIDGGGGSTRCYTC